MNVCILPWVFLGNGAVEAVRHEHLKVLLRIRIPTTLANLKASCIYSAEVLAGDLRQRSKSKVALKNGRHKQNRSLKQ